MGREVIEGIAIGLVAIVTTVSVGSYIAERIEASHAAEHGGHGNQAAHQGADSDETSPTDGDETSSESNSHSSDSD